MTSTLVIVLITYQTGPAVIEPCLRSIESAQMPAGWARRVVVQENSESRALAELVDRFGGVFSTTGANIGFGRACNRAIGDCSAAETILLLNPDTVLESDALVRLIGALESAARPTLFVGWLMKSGRVQVDAYLSWISSTGRLARRRRYRRYLEQRVADRVVPVEKATGGMLMGRASLLKSLGPFDPAFFLYGEDDDLSRRARRRGVELLAVPAARASHIGGGSSSGSSPLVERARMDATLRVAKIHRGAVAVAALSVELLLVTTLGLLTAGSSGSRGSRTARYDELWRWAQFRFDPPPL